MNDSKRDDLANHVTVANGLCIEALRDALRRHPELVDARRALKQLGIHRGHLQRYDRAVCRGLIETHEAIPS